MDSSNAIIAAAKSVVAGKLPKHLKLAPPLLEHFKKRDLDAITLAYAAAVDRETPHLSPLDRNNTITRFVDFINRTKLQSN